MTRDQQLTYEVDAAATYRKEPTPTIDWGSRVIQCARRSGHVLHVHGDEIRCSQCPAVWKDRGV